MNRRDFVKFGALALSPVVLKYLNEATTPNPAASFDIEVLSDAGVGHVLWESKTYPRGTNLETDTLIVGGGMAGLSAAYQLRNQDFLLCELSDFLGGTSAAHSHKDQYFAQGAHYDLAYPDYYGSEVLDMLYDLNIIDYKSTEKTWEFVDKQYTIKAERESISFDNGVFRKDVLPEGAMRDAFYALIKTYQGKMPLPTRLIHAQFHVLNNITFKDFLDEKLTLNEAFFNAVDYAMMDDWGGTSAEVSALAGLHYYACRPYINEDPELISPPEGNAFFAQRIIQKLPQEALLSNRLVRAIHKDNDGFRVEVVDVKASQQFQITAKKIVYAAQKHALKYIYPAAYPKFNANIYAPWVIVNIILNQPTTDQVYWQNEFLSGEKAFMGFVDSAAQFQPFTKRRTLTAYYCLEPKDRKSLLKLNEQASEWVDKTIGYIEAALQKPIRSTIEKVFIKVMGHAMPIPTPEYLLQDHNQQAHETGIAYAGVDAGRLPLLFEALDSGIQAVHALKKLG